VRVPLRRGLFLLCLVASTACLATAYGGVGSWWGASLVTLPGLFSLFHRKFPGHWLPPAYLSSMLVFAAGGILAGASVQLMLPGACLALAAWDLMNLDRSIGGGRHAEAAGPLERRHAGTLAVALGIGLLVAEAGLVLSFTIPFPVMLLLVILDFFSLGRVSRWLSRRKAGRSGSQT
jgi:hypothetical protein